MKKLSLIFAAFMMVVAPVAMAEMKVGVLDVDAALKQSDAAKAYDKSVKQRFGPQLSKLKKMEADNRKLAQRLEKDGPTMSQDERNKLQLEYKQKMEAFQLEARQFQSDKSRSDQEELAKLGPALRGAVEKLAKDKGYDLIVEQGAVLYVAPTHDVTRQVIELINKQTKK